MLIVRTKSGRGRGMRVLRRSKGVEDTLENTDIGSAQTFDLIP